MPATSIQTPFPLFTDIDGQPLEQGQVWLGVSGLDPIANPITAYWDAALTQVVTQPVTTRGGYPMNGSSVGRLYVNSDYSILIRNRNGYEVLSAPSALERLDSSLITFIQAGAGAVVRTAQSKMRESVSVKDFGAMGDGVTDDTAEIQAALLSLKTSGGVLFFPRGVYLTDAIDLRTYQNITIHGDNEYSEFQYKQTSVIKIRSAATTGIKLADDNLEVPVSLATGIVLRDLCIDANNLATTAINMCRAVKLINCKVTNAVQDGIVFEGGSYPLHLQNVVSQQNGRDGLRIKAPLTTIYTIRDSEFGFNGGNGITIQDGSTALFENVLCQSNTGNGFSITFIDPATYTQPVFLERFTFINCYSEANSAWGFYTTSYNTTPSTYTGKINNLTFVNCSFNSGIAQQAYLRGLSQVSITNSPYLSPALDPLYNTVAIDDVVVQGASKPKYGLDLTTATSGQIEFPSTQNPSANARVLDDYREGTFTPVLEGGTTTGTGTYTAQVGKYTKIGNVIFWSIRLAWSAHTGTGPMRINFNDIPYISGVEPAGVASFQYNDLTVGAGKELAGSVGTGDKIMVLFAADPAGGTQATINMDTSGSIRCSGHYSV